jgi:hypothetical protein
MNPEIIKITIVLIWCFGMVPFYIIDLKKYRMPLYMRLARCFFWPFAIIVSILKTEF